MAAPSPAALAQLATLAFNHGSRPLACRSAVYASRRLYHAPLPVFKLWASPAGLAENSCCFPWCLLLHRLASRIARAQNSSFCFPKTCTLRVRARRFTLAARLPSKQCVSRGACFSAGGEGCAACTQEGSSGRTHRQTRRRLAPAGTLGMHTTRKCRRECPGMHKLLDRTGTKGTASLWARQRALRREMSG